MRNISLLHCFADDAHQPLTNSFLRHIQRPFAPPTLVCSHNDANLSLQKGTVEMAFLYYATKRIRCTSTHTYVFLHLPKPKFPQLHSHWRSWDVFCKNSTVIRSPLLSKNPFRHFVIFRPWAWNDRNQGTECYKFCYLHTVLTNIL